MNQVKQLQTGKGIATELSCEERSEKMNTLFLERIVPFVREVNTRSINSQADGQLHYHQALEYQNRNNKADVIKAKYEQITREYQGQNKQFTEKHAEITVAEATKREDILKNFDSHINSVKDQMKDDAKKSRDENSDITKDTEDL